MLATFSCRQPLAVVQTNGNISVSDNGRKVLHYQAQPLKMAGAFERAGYIHPLYDLEGNELTEDGPEDHPYHRGIYWAWHQVQLKGDSVADGWVSEGIAFRLVDVRGYRRKGRAYIASELRWELTGDRPSAIIREQTTIVVHPSGGHFRTVDITVRLIPLVDSVALGGADDVKGYGGICLRLLLPPDIAFLSQGKPVVAQERAVEAGPWMDFSGTFTKSGKRSGITLMVHPDGSGASRNWILREKKSMQNSVFPGRIPQLIPPEGWTLKYRLIVHDGSLEAPPLEALYQSYTHEK